MVVDFGYGSGFWLGLAGFCGSMVVWLDFMGLDGFCGGGCGRDQAMLFFMGFLLVVEIGWATDGSCMGQSVAWLCGSFAVVVGKCCSCSL